MSSPRIFQLFIWFLITTYTMANSEHSLVKRFSLDRRRAQSQNRNSSAYAGRNNDEERKQSLNDRRAKSDGLEESGNNGGPKENYNDGRQKMPYESSSYDGRQEGGDNARVENNYGEREENNNDTHEKNNYGEPKESNNDGEREQSKNDSQKEANNADEREEVSNYKEDSEERFNKADEERDIDNKREYISSPQVDEIGTKILDTEINDSDDEETMFFPFANPVYNTFNKTKRRGMMRLSKYGIFRISEPDMPFSEPEDMPMVIDEIPAHIDAINITNTVNTTNKVKIKKDKFPVANLIKTNCYAKLEQNAANHTIIIQYISIPGRKPFKVRCEPQTRPECAYTVVMERKTIHDNFDLNLQKYREGFGDVEKDGAFFVGLENLYAITQIGRRAIKFETHFEGEKLKAEFYNNFIMDNDEFGYEIVRLDALTNHSMVRRLRLGSKFITKDTDHGSGLSICAKQLGVGWWFSKFCKYSSRMSSIRAYLKSPFVMAIRPSRC